MAIDRIASYAGRAEVGVRRTRVSIPIVLLLAGVLMLPQGARNAWACDCVGLKPLSPAVRTEASFIFTGRVLEIVERNEHMTTTRADGAETSVRAIDRRVVFQVTQAWRGVSRRRFAVSAEQSDCMFNFEPGRAYLVFAHNDARGRASTSICTRTTALEQADAILDVLGAPSFVPQ